MSPPRTEIIRACPEFPNPTASELATVAEIDENDPFWDWMDRITKLKKKLEECNAR